MIFGLRPLGNSQDICNLAKYIRAITVLHVCTEPDTSNLVTYFMSPNQRSDVIIKELNEGDEVRIEPK